MATTTTSTIVQQLIKTLSETCELESDGIKTISESFHSVILPYITSIMAQTGAPVAEKTKTTKGKAPKKDTSAPKAEKIPPKNGYHIFVAEKMTEVVTDNSVAPKERMGKIGGMWKGMTEEGKQVYNDKAGKYNAFVTKEVAGGDWVSRQAEIIDAANASIGVAPKKPAVKKTKTAEKKVEKTEDVEVEEAVVEKVAEKKAVEAVVEKPAEKKVVEAVVEKKVAEPVAEKKAVEASAPIRRKTKATK